MKKGYLLSFLFLILSLVFFSAQAETKSTDATETLKTQKEYSDLLAAIKNGKAWLTFRTRYEHVNIAGFRKANATTLQSILGYQTARFYGFGGLLEMADVTNLFGHKYNSGQGTSPVQAARGYALIADPTATVLNRAVVSYYQLPESTLSFGRQTIKLDNERFISDMDWRQTQLRFDSVSGQTKIIPYTKAFYAYTWNAPRIFTPKATTAAGPRYDAASHFVNLQFIPLDLVNFIAYSYIINNKNAPATSNDSFGLAVKGRWLADDKNNKLFYRLESARQKGRHNNPNHYNEGYYHLLIGGVFQKMVVVKVAREKLEGNGSVVGGVNGSVFTPYALLNRFNGWADVFAFATPANGLKDTYAKIGAIIQPWDASVSVTYHDFRASLGDFKYGKEWDLEAKKSLFDIYSLGVRYANYHAEQGNIAGTVNTKKLWLLASAKFV